MHVLARTVCLSALLLAGCVSPNPYSGGGPAPVVDRSSIAGTSPGTAPNAVNTPGVEVTPLDRQTPLAPIDGALVVEDIPAPEPAGPPTIQRRPKPSPAPAPAPGGNQAVVALLDSAAAHLGAQDLDKAAADLERAVRIEPNNAAIWHDLGQIRLHQSRYQDAQAMASKSNGLATGNRALQARNWRLIAVARRSLGDAVGAAAADAQAEQLE